MKRKNQVFLTASLLKTSRLGVETLLLPSLPAISIALDEPKEKVQMTVTLYILGLLLSKLTVSAFGDELPPKKLLLILLPFMTLGSLLALYPSLPLILTGRLLQGFSLGGATSIGLLILKSQYDKQEMKSRVSLLGALTLWGPLVAILLGGFIQHFFDWKMNVLFIAGFSIILIGASYFYLPSKNEKVKKRKKTKTARYRIVLHSGPFLATAFAYSSFLAGRIVIYTMTPFIFIHYLKLPAYVYGIMLLPYYIGAFISNYFNKIYPDFLSCLSAILFSLVCAYSSIGLLCLYELLGHYFYIFFTVSFFLFGVAEGSCTTNCLSSYPLMFPSYTGTASSISGIIASIYSMLCVLLVTHLLSGSVTSMVFGLFVIVSLCLLPTAYLALIKSKSV